MAGVERPVIVVGMPRSGTTALFETLASHPDLGWFSYHLERLPGVPAVAALARLAELSPAFRKAIAPSGSRRPWLEKLRDGPSEAYSVWERCCGEKFRHDYLLGRSATEEERARTRALVACVLRYQGRTRFAAKLTGPARMGFLLSIFPDAAFVHVVRDGRAVVSSLMRVDFWRESWRMHEPAWRGGLKEAYRRALEERGGSPLALAALQWRNVIERTREERDRHRPRAYLEVRYEDFLREPEAVVERIGEAVGLAPSDRIRRFLARRLELVPDAERFRRDLAPDELALLDELLGDRLAELGYASPA